MDILNCYFSYILICQFLYIVSSRLQLSYVFKITSCWGTKKAWWRKMQKSLVFTTSDYDRKLEAIFEILTNRSELFDDKNQTSQAIARDG